MRWELGPGVRAACEEAPCKKWAQETGLNLFRSLLSKQLENNESRGDAKEMQCFVQWLCFAITAVIRGAGVCIVRKTPW